MAAVRASQLLKLPRLLLDSSQAHAVTARDGRPHEYLLAICRRPER
jgi:hypothetical protein